MLAFSNKLKTQAMADTILVIEDNVSMRENTSELLELAGYKIFSAENGMVGLELAKKNIQILYCVIS